MTILTWRSTDRGAPTVAGQQGSMCALAESVLVKGYPTVSSSITRSGTVATVSATAHGHATGDKVSISGAVEVDYNGTFVVTVTDANTFTYTVDNSPTTPATGTILSAGITTAGTVTLTRSSQTVTASLTSHGFSVGQRVVISGANEAGYNGLWHVATVADADTFTYVIPVTGATPDTPATGTILARYGTHSAGWSLSYTATNKRIFKQGASGSLSQMVLRLNESTATVHDYGCGMQMAESASGIDTLTNAAYTTEGASYTGTLKSGTADSATRPWIMIGDDGGRTIIIGNAPQITYTNGVRLGYLISYFGDAKSYVPGDTYPQFQCPAWRNSGGTSFTTVAAVGAYASYMNDMAYSFPYFAETLYMPSAYADTTNGVSRWMRNHAGTAGFMAGYTVNPVARSLTTTLSTGPTYTTNISGQYFPATIYDAYPDPASGGFNMAKPVLVHATTSPRTGNLVVRGEMKGLWFPLHRLPSGWVNGDRFSGSGETEGKTFEVLILPYHGASATTLSYILVEISDTWG